MKIRAHHLLCIQGFQGHGYSKEFSQNMEHIISFLKSSPEQKIEIIGECDEICKCCPHNKNEKCKNLISNWTIKQMDKRVIKKLGINYGTEIKAKDIPIITNRTFKNLKNLKGICNNCKWKDKCLWYLSKKELKLKIRLFKD